MSSYDDYKPRHQKPSKEYLNLLNATVAEVGGDAKAIIVGFKDVTSSILSKLKAYHYEHIVVSEDVANIILDLNSQAFDGTDDLDVVSLH